MSNIFWDFLGLIFSEIAIQAYSFFKLIIMLKDFISGALNTILERWRMLHWNQMFKTLVSTTLKLHKTPASAVCHQSFGCVCHGNTTVSWTLPLSSDYYLKKNWCNQPQPASLYSKMLCILLLLMPWYWSTSHQYPQCWRNSHCIRQVNKFRKWNEIKKKLFQG